MIKLLDLLNEGPQIGKRPVRTYKLVQGKEAELSKVKNSKVVDYIKKNPENINIEDLAKFLSVREQVALQFINVLKQAGALVPKDGTTSKPSDMSDDEYVDSLFKEAKHMTPAQKKKRGKIYDKLVAGGMESDKAGAIATSKAMAEKMDPVGQEDEDIDNDGDVDSSDKYLLKRRKAIGSNIKEGDHEVSMAQASLKAIAQASLELSQKIGNIERNIPGWIQDHIAKAENYIEQAAQGFHELKHDE